MEAREFVDHLARRFGHYVLHHLEFTDLERTLAFLSSLPFASGSGRNLRFPRDHMEVRIFRAPRGPVVAMIGGQLSVDENYEVRKKGEIKALRMNSMAVGDSELAKLAAASERAKRRPPPTPTKPKRERQPESSPRGVLVRYFLRGFVITCCLVAVVELCTLPITGVPWDSPGKALIGVLRIGLVLGMCGLVGGVVLGIASLLVRLLSSTATKLETTPPEKETLLSAFYFGLMIGLCVAASLFPVVSIVYQDAPSKLSMGLLVLAAVVVSFGIGAVAIGPRRIGKIRSGIRRARQGAAERQSLAKSGREQKPVPPEVAGVGRELDSVRVKPQAVKKPESVATSFRMISVKARAVKKPEMVATSFKMTPPGKGSYTDCRLKIAGQCLQVQFPGQYDARGTRLGGWYTVFDVRLAKAEAILADERYRMKLEEVFLPLFRKHFAGWIAGGFGYWIYASLLAERGHPVFLGLGVVLVAAILALLGTAFAFFLGQKNHSLMNVYDEQGGHFTFAIPERGKDKVFAQLRRAGWTIRKHHE